VDGMALDKIDAIIDAVRHERYRWTPVRRTYIPKKSGKLRPLGLPTWSDKLLQEGLRLLLEAYYEPQFSPHSHGFRPGRGCHTALGEITKSWRGVTWVIEGDISQCFDSLDHEVMLAILRERIHDNRFLRLLSNLLKAGYLEDWRFNATLSGAPQGGVLTAPCGVPRLTGVSCWPWRIPACRKRLIRSRSDWSWISLPNSDSRIPQSSLSKKSSRSASTTHANPCASKVWMASIAWWADLPGRKPKLQLQNFRSKRGSTTCNMACCTIRSATVGMRSSRWRCLALGIRTGRSGCGW
jgi:hypothetical protein